MSLALDFLAIYHTVNCVSWCDHCFLNTFPSNQPHVHTTVSQLDRWLDGVEAIQRVAILGGEPLLAAEALPPMIRFLKTQKHVPMVDLMTTRDSPHSQGVVSGGAAWVAGLV